MTSVPLQSVVPNDVEFLEMFRKSDRWLALRS
jgi:hypothetical protein